MLKDLQSCKIRMGLWPLRSTEEKIILIAGNEETQKIANDGDNEAVKGNGIEKRNYLCQIGQDNKHKQST